MQKISFEPWIIPTLSKYFFLNLYLVKSLIKYLALNDVFWIFNQRSLNFKKILSKFTSLDFVAIIRFE
jgi:hypothetical protein